MERVAIFYDNGVFASTAAPILSDLTAAVKKGKNPVDFELTTGECFFYPTTINKQTRDFQTASRVCLFLLDNRTA